MNSEKSIPIVAVITAICLLGDTMLYIVLPVYWQDVGLTSLWEVGVVLSVNRLIRLPLNPFVGWLYNRMTLRVGLTIAVFLAFFATTGYGIFKGFYIWIILRAAWGIAWSFIRMGGYFTVIRYSNDNNRGRWMGTFQGISRLGGLAGMVIGGTLVPILGIQSVSIAFGLIILISLPIIFMFIANEKVNDEVEHAKPWIKDLLSKPVMIVLVSGLLIAFLHAIFSSTLSLIIDTNYSKTVHLFGVVLSSTALAGILQSARSLWDPFLARFFGMKSDEMGTRLPIFLLGLLGSAIGYVLVPWELPISVWILIILFVMISGTAIQTLMDALTSDVAKATSVVTVMTAYSVATDVGSALGPMLSFVFIEMKNGLMMVYTGAAFMYLLMMVFYRTQRRKEVAKMIDH